MIEALTVTVALLLLLVAGLWMRLRRAASSGPVPRGLEALQGQLNALRRRQLHIEELLERMEEGVLVLDDSLLPVTANPSARRLLGLRGNGLPTRAGSEPVKAIARRAIARGSTVEDVVGTWPQRRRLRARATPLQGEGGVIVVLQDVTEELRTQQIRRQFVANASHELKSPVAGLQALAEAIGQAVRDDPDAAERFSSRLVSETHRLARLIADLLDLSRLEDPANASVTEVNLSDVTSGIVAETAAVADAKSIRPNIDVEPNLFIRGDKQQLQLLVRNLVDNAVRYTPEGGSVTVELQHEDDHVVLRVADTGIGIPLRAQGRIFERFYRVDKDRSRERGGTGLGLSIVRHVVELHGGHIELHSELGAGSTFTAHLPALRTARVGARTEEPVRAASRSSE